MPTISYNEIRKRATEFSKRWEGVSEERAEAQSFWNEFLQLFGVDRKRVALFEKSVERLDQSKGRIDLFWKGTLLVEHKSLGLDLDSAYTQAEEYLYGLEDYELPKYILVSDFHKFRLHDLESNKEWDFSLNELSKNIQLFSFIAGYRKLETKKEDPVNIKAAELMADVHDVLDKNGYSGHALEMLLTRLVFCLFADDTGIFDKGIFREYVDTKTNPDGSDLGMHLRGVFEVLNTSEDKRQKNLDEALNQFPYVDGGLFAEILSAVAFDSDLRKVLLKAADLDWSSISPAIFGSLFQYVMDATDKSKRRSLGAHYTSEENILKVIKPLFLNELLAEFEKHKKDKKALVQFQNKLASLKFLDPACGCGNFLVITYRELRLLEHEVIKILYPDTQGRLDVGPLVKVDVDQMSGIEIEEFPAQVAGVALWLTDHQMNMRLSVELGQYFKRLPLVKKANIRNANALQIDWQEVVPKNELSYILGNPPFLGKKEQSDAQKKDLEGVLVGIRGGGVLDFVTGWYIKAAQYIQDTGVSVAFVSTNSISQGEQVGILWKELIEKYHVSIDFAYRTFPWSNDAKGKAAVHCVIIGFSEVGAKIKRIFDSEFTKGEANETFAQNINPYLVDAPTVFIEKRSNPFQVGIPEMHYGSMPIDDGWLILDEKQKNELLKENPQAAPYIKTYKGGDEFLNNVPRFCLWLVGVDPNAMRAMPSVMRHVEQCKKFREKSEREATKKLALSPALFGEIRQPTTNYLFVPKVSSEKRTYLPIGFCTPDIIASGTALIVPSATLYHLGILTSIMHMAWMRAVCGRLESRYQYSASIVYNNFPWPKEVSDEQKKKIEAYTQTVLDARAKFPDASLADLYDPLTMPPELSKAHQELDHDVDKAYGRTDFKTEADRIAFLFEQYQKLTAIKNA